MLANKKVRLQKIMGWIFIVSAVLTIACIVTASISNEMYWQENANYDEVRRSSLRNIISHIEYNGLDEQGKTMMQEHVSKYTQYGNFIVIDSAFRVEYALNQGYLDDTDYFYPLFDSYSNHGLICDAQGTVLSVHALESDDYTSFLNLSKLYGAYDIVFQKELSAIAAGETSYATERGYYGSDVRESSMYYGGIPSKNMHVFFIYDSGSSSWNLQSDQSIAYHVQNLVQSFLFISLMIYWLSLPIWIFLDATRRNYHPALWGVLALFTNVIGLLVYIVARPGLLQCKNCKEPLQSNFMVCPTCGLRNREQCTNCSMAVKDEWNHCPYCGLGLRKDHEHKEEEPVQ